MFRVSVRGLEGGGVGGLASEAQPFAAPPGECVHRGATVSVCDSSFVDLKLTVLKPMVSTLSQVVNVFFLPLNVLPLEDKNAAASTCRTEALWPNYPQLAEGCETWSK